MMNISIGRTSALAAGGLALVALGIGAIALIGNKGTATASCAPYEGSAYVFVEGGAFQMGSDNHYPDEAPARPAQVEGFWMKSTEVTNAEFAAFAAATSYVTVAERAPPEGGLPGSAVFVPPEEGQRVRPMSWWHWVEGADWRHPEGPGSSIENRMTHPVTQIAYEDALAYAQWAGEDLPSETEWEFAASAGGTVGDDPYRMEDGSRVLIANTWQGFFPLVNTGEDGHPGTAPAGCFEANAFGLLDTIGNVWEWTTTPNPARAASGVIKGGSYLCAPNYCMRYRPAAREAQETGLGTNHVGFRTIRRTPPPPEGQING